RELLASHGDDIRYVWRHLPLNDVHPTAQLAAEAAEAAAAQGKFWEMYDTLLAHQRELSPRDLVGYARDLGLDVDRFRDELRRREYTQRINADVASADESGVSGTPTFFINGRRHYGVYDIDTLTEESVPPSGERGSSRQPPRRSRNLPPDHPSPGAPPPSLSRGPSPLPLPLDPPPSPSP
ncbi:MAG: thioredoxin domain-containing protein, partial [Solirubrobacterales bacterium]|nr:thioredoxin domain-containing protein [Solirubrobacterales bacterium]